MFPAGQRSAGEAWSKWIDQERHSLVMLLLLEPAARAGPYKYAFNVSVSNKFTMQICRTNYIATCRCTGGAPLSSCKCGAPLSRRCLRRCLSCHLASEVRGRVLGRGHNSARTLASACSTSATRCSLFTARAVLHTYIHMLGRFLPEGLLGRTTRWSVLAHRAPQGCQPSGCANIQAVDT